MRARFASKAAGWAALIVQGGAAYAQGVPFETAFPTGAAPRFFHARLLYRGPDGVHRLELWRDGDTAVRRDTDDRLVTIAVHRPGDPGYRMDMFDRARRIHNVVDRGSLYHVGRFTEWTGLAHGLSRPVGRYRIRQATVRSPVRPVAPCRWYALEVQDRRSLVCWSAAQGFPIVILNGANQPIWKVTQFDAKAPPPALFRPKATGYVLNDVAADMAAD